MKKGIRRKIALVLAGLMIVSALAACSSGKTGSDSGENGEKTGKGITIRLLTRMSGEDSGTKLKESILEEFQKKYPDIMIQDESTNDSNSFNNQFKTDIASGNAADIIQWPGISIMKEYADSEVFLDLTDLIEATPDIKDNIEPTLLEMMDLSSIGTPGIYALPINNQMEVFFYNKDLFEKAGIEKVPETWDEFSAVCGKLEAIGVTPWTLGASNAWRIIHIQTGLLYKMCGVEKAVELGAQEAKWTDPDVIATVQFIQSLGDKGVFGKDYTGIDYETEKAQFISEQTAMTFDGTWRIADFADMEDKVGVFRMPYFSDKEEYKDNDIAYPSQLELGGHLKDDPEKAEYVWELATMFTNRDSQLQYAEEIGNVPVRNDLDLDSANVNSLLRACLDFKENEIKVWGSDAWAYDTAAVLEDIVAEALTGAVTGMTAEEATRQIQERLDEVHSEQ